MLPHGPLSVHARPPAHRRGPRRRLLGALLAGLAFVPLACGGDDGSVAEGPRETSGANQETDEAVADPGESEDADAVRDKVAQDFKSGVNSGLGNSAAQVTDEQADCAAEGIIDALGLKRATELNETGDEIRLSTQEADRVVPVVRRCLDFAALLAAGILQGAEGKISDTAANCLAGELENTALVDDALTAAMTGTEADPTADQASSKALLDAMSACLSPEDLQKLGS